MERQWFRAKSYGWGWTPSTWQGWVITFIYAAIVAAFALVFLRPNFGMAGWIEFGAAIVVASALLIGICYLTGEKPRWQWGDKSGQR